MTLTYKMYYEDVRKHKEIKKLIETNYKKYHNEYPSKDNQIACNDTVKNRLLCVIALEKDASTFANRFAGNLVTYSGLGFTLKVVGNTLYLATGISQTAAGMNLNSQENTRINIAIGGLVGLSALSIWAGNKIIHFGQSLKKNGKSHIIIYDIRDCNTNRQCPNSRLKNKSTKTPAKTKNS